MCSTYISVSDASLHLQYNLYYSFVPQLTFSGCHTGLVQYRERLPTKIIIGACVGGGLLLIILLCVIVAVLYWRKTSNQNRQQQALPRQPRAQPQPQQWQRAHKNVRNVTAQGYLNDHMAPRTHKNVRNITEHGYFNGRMVPSYGNYFTPLADNGQYLQPTPASGMFMGQIAVGGGGYVHVGVHSAPQYGTAQHLSSNGEYLQPTPARGIPLGQITGNGNYVNDHMAAKRGNPFNPADKGEYFAWHQ